MRQSMDRVGVKPFFIASLITCILGKCYWLFLVIGFDVLIPGVIFIFFLNGVSLVMWQTAHLKYSPQLCSLRHRSVGVAIQTAVTGIFGGLSPLLWGWLLRGHNGSSGFNTGFFVLYFIIATSVMSILVVFYRYIKEEHIGKEGLVNHLGPIRKFRRRRRF